MTRESKWLGGVLSVAAHTKLGVVASLTVSQRYRGIFQTRAASAKTPVQLRRDCANPKMEGTVETAQKLSSVMEALLV